MFIYLFFLFVLVDHLRLFILFFPVFTYCSLTADNFKTFIYFPVFKYLFIFCH